MGGLLSAACSPEGRSDQYTVFKDEQTIIDALHAGADLRTLQRILAKGNIIDHGGPILHQAMTTGSIDSALLMLRLGRLVLHPRDSYLLIVALQLPPSDMQLELLHLLLAQGCVRGFNVNYIHHGQDGDDDTDTVFTPLSYALAHGQPEAALLLLHFGADPNVSLGSLYQGLYTPFSEWCRRVLLAPLHPPLPDDDGPSGHQDIEHTPNARTGSVPRDIRQPPQLPAVSVWGTPLEPDVPLPHSPRSGSSCSASDAPSSLTVSCDRSSSPLDAQQQQLLFASRVRQSPAGKGGARGGVHSKAPPLASDAPRRVLKRTHSASSEMEETKAQLRRFQRESSLQGMLLPGGGRVPPPAYLRRSAVLQQRLLLGHPMCSVKLARALLRGGCDPNECVGASAVFKLVGVPALQHTLAWPDVVAELLKGGADPDGHPQFAVTPLLQACDSCDVPWQTVLHLLQAGANPSLACLVKADTPPSAGEGGREGSNRRRSVSSQEPSPRLDVSSLRACTAGAKLHSQALRRRSSSAPTPSPRRGGHGAAAPNTPHVDVQLFMTPFEALCGRIVEEMGANELDDVLDLPPGALLPPDAEAIARLLPAYGADMQDVRKQLQLLGQVAPCASRAAQREAYWGLRSRVVVFRTAFRQEHMLPDDETVGVAGSVKSAPAGFKDAVAGQAGDPPSSALHAIATRQAPLTSRSLLLMENTTGSNPNVARGGGLSSGKRQGITCVATGVDARQRGRAARTYSYGRDRPTGAVTHTSTRGTRRHSLQEAGASVSARNVRVLSLAPAGSNSRRHAQRQCIAAPEQLAAPGAPASSSGSTVRPWL